MCDWVGCGTTWILKNYTNLISKLNDAKLEFLKIDRLKICGLPGWLGQDRGLRFHIREDGFNHRLNLLHLCGLLRYQLFEAVIFFLKSLNRSRERPFNSLLKPWLWWKNWKACLCIFLTELSRKVLCWQAFLKVLFLKNMIKNRDRILTNKIKVNESKIEGTQSRQHWP